MDRSRVLGGEVFAEAQSALILHHTQGFTAQDNPHAVRRLWSLLHSCVHPHNTSVLFSEAQLGSTAARQLQPRGLWI